MSAPLNTLAGFKRLRRIERGTTFQTAVIAITVFFLIEVLFRFVACPRQTAIFQGWLERICMYATQEIYPLSWIYYLTSIFLTSFVFLNMMIGAILEVMSEEQNARQVEQAHNERDELMQKLQTVQNQISELSQQIANKK